MIMVPQTQILIESRMTKNFEIFGNSVESSDDYLSYEKYASWIQII